MVSRAAIHNLSAAEDRAKAIGQIACVLKPGGQALIDDIRHHGEYVAAFAGSDIETNPPATNAWIHDSGRTFARAVDRMPPDDVLAEIDAKVDMDQLESVLMAEGLQKFADPQKALIALIGEKRAALK